MPVIDQHYLNYVKELMSFYEKQVRNLPKAIDVDTYLKSYITKITEIQATMQNSPVFREYQNMLKDIKNLPTTYVCTSYAMTVHNSVKYERSRYVNPNCLGLLQEPPPNPNEYNEVEESNTEAPNPSIEAFLKGYACAKMKDLKILREIKSDVRYSEHKELLQEIEDQWIEGSIVSSPLMMSPYQMHRFVGIPDAIENKDFTHIIQRNEELKQINLALQVTICELQQQKCETMFKDLPEIAQLGPFDVSKVSLKVISDAKVPLDNNIVLSKKHQATKIRLRYEGVKDATTLDLQAFCKEPYKIYETECKLLLALAFWGKDKEKNRGMIEALMKDYKSDCISHLNGMLRTIFKRDKHVKFIDKAKSEIYFTIELE